MSDIFRRFGLELEIVAPESYGRAVEHFRQHRVVLPTFAQLADPLAMPASILRRLEGTDLEAADPLNLFRVDWHNQAAGGHGQVPEYVELPTELTAVPARILVALGNRFPLIRCHKVLAAFACLVPRILSGRFDPSRDRAVWPSTGNFCRGGVAISKIMGCRGVAVLPEGMSQERFDWLAQWIAHPEDIVRTPGSESNVREIFECCDVLARDPQNLILNQFCEFGNHLVHYFVTGAALERIFHAAARHRPDTRLAAFVAASGSAGTLGAGDYFKEKYDCKIAAVEPLECPTMLYNGFGSHNIQGIGDKHIPLIHNVTNTDFVIGISDRSTDALNVLFNTAVGQDFLTSKRRVLSSIVRALPSFGLSSICNVLAAIKTARRLRLGAADAVITVATDGADLYRSECERTVRREFAGNFSAVEAEAVHTQHLLGVDTEHVLELGPVDQKRIFNLGYFTWVEQRGVGLEEFEARRAQSFWHDLRSFVPAWDERIREFNDRTGALGN